jgi:hypothetical protein
VPAEVPYRRKLLPSNSVDNSPIMVLLVVLHPEVTNFAAHFFYDFVFCLSTVHHEPFFLISSGKRIIALVAVFSLDLRLFLLLYQSVFNWLSFFCNLVSPLGFIIVILLYLHFFLLFLFFPFNWGLLFFIVVIFFDFPLALFLLRLTHTCVITPAVAFVFREVLVEVDLIVDVPVKIHLGIFFLFN